MGRLMIGEYIFSSLGSNNIRFAEDRGLHAFPSCVLVCINKMLPDHALLPGMSSPSSYQHVIVLYLH